MSSELSAVGLAVGLFLLGVASPGPNFLVVAQRSMGSGFRAGCWTGLGVATGDALYAAAGFLGLATLVSEAGFVFGLVRLLGGLYLAWLGLSMATRRGSGTPGDRRCPPAPAGAAACWRAGLVTDLANPKTVVFFASVFSTAYDPSLPHRTLAAMWLGIVAASVLWRVGLAAGFSRDGVRALYARFRRRIEIAFGVLLVAFGLRLAATSNPR